MWSWFKCLHRVHSPPATRLLSSSTFSASRKRFHCEFDLIMTEKPGRDFKINTRAQTIFYFHERNWNIWTKILKISTLKFKTFLMVFLPFSLPIFEPKNMISTRQLCLKINVQLRSRWFDELSRPTSNYETWERDAQTLNVLGIEKEISGFSPIRC